MRIAHLSAEVAPFARTGGLGDVVGALPKAQAALGHDPAVWMPLYRTAWQSLSRLGSRLELACEPFDVELGFRTHRVGLLRTELPDSHVPLFLLGSDPHFDRPDIYSPGPDGYDDGLQRYALFVRAVMLAMARIGMVPDVLHAHDWHTTLAPMIAAWERPAPFRDTATVLTVHNMAYQGMYGGDWFHHLGLPAQTRPLVEWNGIVNLMKGGLGAADAITAVSPTFAREIATPDGGFGLHPMVQARAGSVFGIVNGIDTSIWNPATDPRIPFNYDVRRLRRKAENRRALLALAGMDKTDPRMVVGLVGRLTDQKGIDMLMPVLGDLLGNGVRFVVLGSGDDGLESAVWRASHQAQGKFWGFVGWNEELAHLIEAGADAFLMPSRFEPCGLNQLYSLAYGTPPIVRRVGGLADTVVAYDGANRPAATGFGFHAAHPLALRDTVLWARHCFENPTLWGEIVRRGMAEDHSWERSAARYEEVYRLVLSRRGRDLVLS